MVVVAVRVGTQGHLGEEVEEGVVAKVVGHLPEFQQLSENDKKTLFGTLAGNTCSRMITEVKNLDLNHFSDWHNLLVSGFW